MSEPTPLPPLRYSVRLSLRADREAVEAMLWLDELTGDPTFALEWYDALLAAAGTLAEQPHRYPVQEHESHLLKFPTRRLVYRHTPSSAAYHLYYWINDESDDGPRVTVIHVRYAAGRSLTAREARELRQNQ